MLSNTVEEVGRSSVIPLSIQVRMGGRFKKPALPDVSQIVMNWDMSRVKARMAQEGHARETLDALEQEYKKYLFLVVTHGNHLPISAPIDEMWHTHVLFTRDYAKFGKAVGGFIHHEPVLTEVRRQELLPNYEKTLTHYRNYWGEPDPKFWPPHACVCDPEGEGTDGDGEGGTY